jgi:hypothetical protein
MSEAKTATRAAKDAATHAAETARDTTDKITDTTTDTMQKAADGGREMMLMGMHAAADMGQRLGDISYGRGHRILSSMTQAVDIYRDASERSAGNLQSLFSSWLTISRGAQQMQHAWLEMIDHALSRAAHKPQDLLRCRDLVELAEAQRDLYIDTVNQAVGSSTHMLQLAGRAVQEAARPLENGSHRR